MRRRRSRLETSNLHAKIIESRALEMRLRVIRGRGVAEELPWDREALAVDEIRWRGAEVRFQRSSYCQERAG